MIIEKLEIPQELIEKLEEKAGFYITDEILFISALERIYNVNPNKNPFPNANTIKFPKFNPDNISGRYKNHLKNND